MPNTGFHFSFFFQERQSELNLQKKKPNCMIQTGAI